jgi:deoxycytidine triphosphate deaminase
MILSNVEIRKALNEGRLLINPNPQPSDYDTTAVNLHLGSALSIPQPGAFNYDLRRGGIATTLSRNCEHLEIPAAGYVLEPEKFVLGVTRERIALPIIPSGTFVSSFLTR